MMDMDEISGSVDESAHFQSLDKTDSESAVPEKSTTSVVQSGDAFPFDRENKILRSIFKNFNIFELSRVARVCKNWKVASEDDNLWKEFLPSTIRDTTLPTGISWKALYLNRRKEALVSCTQDNTTDRKIYIRLDKDTFNSGEGGEITGEVILYMGSPDKLMAPVTVRFIGYEESFDSHVVYADNFQELPISNFSRRNKWNREIFPINAERGLHCFPFCIPIPKRNDRKEPLPPSLHYVWRDGILGNETFANEFLVVAKAPLADEGEVRRSKPITILPTWNPQEKFSRIRFSNSENVYTSRFPFANVKLKAALQMHPNVIDNTHLEFEVLVEVESVNTSVSGPVTVSLYHTAESEEYVAPDLHAQRISKDFPVQISKAYSGSPFKKKLDISIPQKELWLKKIRGPGAAWASCVHSIQVSLRVSIFTTISVNMPIEFLLPGEANTDASRPVVTLEDR